MTVSLCVNFHSEGHLAHKSSISAELVAKRARVDGVDTQLVAILDRADTTTARSVENSGVAWDDVMKLNSGDLGEARNIAARSLRSEFVSFLDGDDLCGENWIAESFSFWKSENLAQAILHPEYVYYFHENDYETPPVLTELKSFWFRHVNTEPSSVQQVALSWNNTFTSNSFGLRRTFVDNPFIRRCLDHGFGIEDWSWNQRTSRDGISHMVVPRTVHLVRVTGGTSLGSLNFQNGLLPDFDNHWERLHKL